MAKHELTIGEVARRSGLAPSALRYYEQAGLLIAPSRRSRQRRYDQAALGRIRLIQQARAAGFSIEETRRFISGFPENDKPSARWRSLAERKRKELDALIAQATAMKKLLDTSFQCECGTLAECEAGLARKAC